MSTPSQFSKHLHSFCQELSISETFNRIGLTHASLHEDNDAYLPIIITWSKTLQKPDLNK